MRLLQIAGREYYLNLPFRFSIMLHSSRLAITSNPRVGSPRNKTYGSLMSAIAILKRLCQPPDKVFAFFLLISFIPKEPIISSAFFPCRASVGPVDSLVLFVILVILFILQKNCCRHEIYRF